MLRTTLLAIAILISILPSARAQQITGNPPAEMRAAEDQLQKALVKGDTETLSKLLADDYLRTAPTTPNTTKTQYLDALRSGTLKYFSIEAKESHYRTYGDTVIVNSVSAIRVNINGQQRDEVLRLINVWIKKDGRWQLAAVQGNPLPSQ
jgi:ketosteroid isomerase-like protein